MRLLTTGLVVVGLLLLYAQAFGEETKTLEEWGFPPISQWVLKSTYTDSLTVPRHPKGTVIGEVYVICEDYDIPSEHSNVTYTTYRYSDEVKWCVVIMKMVWGAFVYEDYDYDGLWTGRTVYY